MRDSFGERVAAAVRETGPLCAGVDPSRALLAAWGLSDDAEGLRAFCDACVEAFAGAVGVIKPQAAFFERHGSAGMAVLEHLLASTITSNPAALAADAVTVHAYLGLAALAPLVRLAGASGRGVLVVARSSNPEGRALQEAVAPGGASVEDTLLGLRVRAARRGDFGARAGCAGRPAERRGRAVLRLRAGHRVAEQLPRPTRPWTRSRRARPPGPVTLSRAGGADGLKRENR